MLDDLSPESLRQFYKERAAADDSLRRSQEQKALYQSSEIMEVPAPAPPPAPEPPQRDLFAASFAKLDASLKSIDYNLEATHLQRMEQLQKDHTAHLSVEAKIDQLVTLYDSQRKDAQRRQRVLITIGLVNLAVTLLFGILILALK